MSRNDQGGDALKTSKGDSEVDTLDSRLVLGMAFFPKNAEAQIFYGCVKNTTEALRLVGAPGACTGDETQLKAVKGPKGDKGDPGDAGPDGAPGARPPIRKRIRAKGVELTPVIPSHLGARAVEQVLGHYDVTEETSHFIISTGV